MYEVKQAQVARAIDILRGGPLTASQFAGKMWPDREYKIGRDAQAGHAFLRRLGEIGYVDHVGEYWAIRRHQPSSGDGSAVGTAVGLPDPLAVGLPDGLGNGLPVHPSVQQPDGQADRLRLARLVQQATDPVKSVTHDAVFGDLKVHRAALDGALVEACAIVVLAGRSANVYPPCGAPKMIVGLSPAEGARALYLRWTQSSQAPDLPRFSAWITIEDGIVAMPGFWRPAGAPEGWMDPEDVRARVARQRAAAGLA